MNIFRLLAIVGVALLLAACGADASSSIPEDAISVGTLRISNVWMRTPNEASDADAVYMVIRNTGNQDDQLIGATSDVATVVELHQTTAEGGVVTMRPITAIAIPAGGAIAIESGAYHLMLLNRTRLVQPGDNITLNLTFANAGSVSLEAEVRDAAPATEGGRGGSGDHGH